MTRPISALLALSLVLAACGDASPPADAPVSGSIHVTGGIAGLDETWTLAADGTVTGPNGESGTISDADLAALRAAIEAADFFALDPSYLPADTCCDRFTYEVTLSEGSRTNTVTTIDAAEAPQALFTLIDLFRTSLRAATA
jgi:hypothetical protein